ncbi:MAG: type VI secretion system baseplate subunit TssK [Myxococcota bacterium]
MRPPSRVIWSEGLLMTPQHMQQLDRFHEGRLNARLDAIDHESWGVLACELDMTALDSGMVAIGHFEGVLPDGTPIAFDSTSREAPPSRPAEEHLAPHQAVLEVFVGLARTHESRNNVGATKGALTRYYATSDMAHDRFGEAQPQDVEVACSNVRLLFGDEPREDYTAIKIAEIRRAADGRLVLSDDYIVPCLRASASAVLARSLDGLLTSMNARRNALLQTVRQRDDSTVEFSAADVTRYLLLATVNSYLPVLRHAVVAGDFSAKEIYLLLSRLAGQLSTFSTEFDPNDVPRFVYEDLRSTFGTIFAALEGLLKATLAKRYVAVSLASRGDAMHQGQIDDDRFTQCTQFVVGVQSSVAENEVSALLPRVAKLASEGDINSLLAAATSGVELQATTKAPPQIPTRAGMTYFVVRTDGDYWRNILIERRIAMYLPNPFTPAETKVEIFGILS